MKKFAAIAIAAMAAGCIGLAGCAQQTEVVEQEAPASTAQETATVEAEPEPIVIEDAAFYYSSDSMVGYMLKVTNPNMGHFTSLYPIDVKFLDEAGNIVGTDSGCYCSQLYPNGTTVISRFASIAPGAVTIEATPNGDSTKFGDSERQQAEIDEMIYIDGLNEVDTGYKPQVVGQVVNSSEYALNNAIQPGSTAPFTVQSMGDAPAHASVEAYVNWTTVSQ